MGGALGFYAGLDAASICAGRCKSAIGRCPCVGLLMPQRPRLSGDGFSLSLAIQDVAEQRYALRSVRLSHQLNLPGVHSVASEVLACRNIGHLVNDPQASEVASSADAIKAALEPCQQLFHKFAGSALTSRNAAAQTAAVYAVQHFWHQAGSPPGWVFPPSDADDTCGLDPVPDTSVYPAVRTCGSALRTTSQAARSWDSQHRASLIAHLFASAQAPAEPVKGHAGALAVDAGSLRQVAGRHGELASEGAPT